MVLIGSSAGTEIAASLSQLAKDQDVFAIGGVLVNVPGLCDYRPLAKTEYEYNSYEQCMGSLLEGGE